MHSLHQDKMSSHERFKNDVRVTFANARSSINYAIKFTVVSCKDLPLQESPCNKYASQTVVSLAISIQVYVPQNIHKTYFWQKISRTHF